MKLVKLTICLGALWLIPHLANADGTKDVDNTVAAGIVFKIAYVMGSHGTWSDLENSGIQSFDKAMTAVSKDLSSFSQSDHGRDLKRQGEALIAFLIRGVTSTATVNNPEGAKFLEEIGIDPENVDPTKLAAIFSKRIESYAEASNTPKWVYIRPEREQGAAPNP